MIFPRGCVKLTRPGCQAAGRECKAGEGFRSCGPMSLSAPPRGTGGSAGCKRPFQPAGCTRS
jgi:hypothetical protein